MTDKPSSNMLECDEADLDYLCNLLKERIREVNVLRSIVRLIETFKKIGADDPMERLRMQVDEKYREYLQTIDAYEECRRSAAEDLKHDRRK